MTRNDPIQWFEKLPCAVTVCDRGYTILYMNDKAAEGAAKDGGRALVGKTLMDCHPPKAQRKLKQVMASRRPNVYTVEKKGVKKVVLQAQWKERGRVGGLVEIYFERPSRMPNRRRD